MYVPILLEFWHGLVFTDKSRVRMAHLHQHNIYLVYVLEIFGDAIDCEFVLDY